ncbi:hypothetical protein PYCCODRAFT_196964 [Trametes coccinea BRFM310]|uniref:Uncharacterized protein n=1 Tax=Trametes coccinea (strain BRFM310) TaxID=1353009 RepID=A0A1Y2IRK9_TRAC3|nr:hypothetical protein PYCCODRAFT_196964 [Trametes coccinea BRFM310]
MRSLHSARPRTYPSLPPSEPELRAPLDPTGRRPSCPGPLRLRLLLPKPLPRSENPYLSPITLRPSKYPRRPSPASRTRCRHRRPPRTHSQSASLSFLPSNRRFHAPFRELCDSVRPQAASSVRPGSALVVVLVTVQLESWNTVLDLLPPAPPTPAPTHRVRQRPPSPVSVSVSVSPRRVAWHGRVSVRRRTAPLTLHRTAPHRIAASRESRVGALHASAGSW